MKRRRRWRIGAGAVAATGAIAVTGFALADRHGGGQGDADRRAQVRELGADVMPFSLDLTRHEFRDTATGGTQRVVLRNPPDAAQRTLIRSHLRTERDTFMRGDFSDPMATHGMQMPGIDELRASAGRMRVVYRDLPDGAELSYMSKEPGLVTALHAWFAAQTSDHGADAGS